MFLLIQPFLGFPYWYTLWAVFSLVHCFYAQSGGMWAQEAQGVGPCWAILSKVGLSCYQRKSRLSWGPEIVQNQLGKPVLGGSSWRPVSAPLKYNFSIWPILSHVHFNVNSILIILPNCATFVGFCSGSRVFKHTVPEDQGSFYKIGLGSPKPLLRSPRITVKAHENDQFWLQVGLSRC